MKPNGISVLLASQNSIRTIDLSVRSFLSFGDEIICVDNGSTDGTIDVLRRLADDYPAVTFINASDVKHLDENRQIAYEHSRFRWVFRGDSDYIAWTSGPRDIRHLRQQVLSHPPGNPPVCFELRANYVVGDWYHSPKGRQESSINRRVFQDVPGMRFCRIGRNETVRLPHRKDGRGWARVFVPTKHILHANIYPPLSAFLRVYRRLWREQGDFARYPTVESYVRERCGDKDGTMDLNAKALERAKRRDKGLVPYEGQYPSIVREHLEMT